MSGTGLKASRVSLKDYLDKVELEVDCTNPNFAGIWKELNPLITNWWKCYETWEKGDTFEKAFSQDRMTVRSFGSTFKDEINKKIAPDIFMVATDRVYQDKKRTPFAKEEWKTVREHQDKMRENGNWQDRGLDSSNYAIPANFITRGEKYKKGLHDLSASLLDHTRPIDKQVHHEGAGIHFSFVPLSKEEDQYMIWRLAKLAKNFKTVGHPFYTLIRDYRSKMTRIKLARDYDLGVGFSAIPTPDLKTPFKLSYSVGNALKYRELAPERLRTGKDQVKLTAQQQLQLKMYLQQQEMKFKQILRCQENPINDPLGNNNNEIVIALRRHMGEFPVFAEKKADGKLACFTITNNEKTYNNKYIDNITGKMS